MSQEEEMVIVPIDGDPLTAVTMIYAIRDAVRGHGNVSCLSRSRSLAIAKLEEAAVYMSVAAAKERE